MAGDLIMLHDEDIDTTQPLYFDPTYMERNNKTIIKNYKSIIYKW